MSNKRILIFTAIITATIIPAIFLILYYIQEKKIDVAMVVANIIYTFVVTVGISLLNCYTYFILKRKLGYEKKQSRRIILELIITCINAALVITCMVYLMVWLFGTIPQKGNSFNEILFLNIIIAIVVNLLVFGFIESYNWFCEWKKLKIESETLKREMAEANYSALKNQVNPHFLFNSLNSLSSLIRLSPDKAIEFVDKFSRIYRYVLDAGDKMVVELHDELDFLQSYIFLQKIRFGNNLIVSIEIESAKLNSYILPLAMQLLVENVVKHNEVSAEKPLTISISTENDYLIIRNNIQLKSTLEDVSGIGLKNLTERYSHFSDVTPEFIITDKEYIAKVPLINDVE